MTEGGLSLYLYSTLNVCMIYYFRMNTTVKLAFPGVFPLGIYAKYDAQIDVLN
uniref:Uncharacterized protein n=1 Tax=Octopus bimaculoides TaxID=37653 RepID=A0A0L8FI19_OCTBM